MQFSKTVFESVTRPASYAARTKESFGHALAYLYCLLVCASLLSVIILTATYFGTGVRAGFASFVSKAETELPALYPTGLVLTLSGGMLSTNAEEPLVIDPNFWKEMQKNDKHPDPKKSRAHLLTIDTSAAAEDYDTYDTVALLTRTSAIFPDKDAGVRVVPYKEMEMTDFEMNQLKYNDMLSFVMPFVRVIPLALDFGVLSLIILLPFAGAFFLWIFYMAYLLVMTLLVQLVSTVMKKKLEYGTLYKLGLYGLTLPILYALVAFWVPVIHVPFVFSLIFLVWMGVVLQKMPPPPAPVKVVASKKPIGTKKTAKKGEKAKSIWDDHAA